MNTPRQTDRAREGRSDAPRSSGIVGPFERLVAILADGPTAAAPADALRRLGSPSGVDRLLRAALLAAVRRGPASEREGWGPARLLDVAVRGAREGAVPVATASALRAVLEDLEARLHTDGLWRPEAPLWWRPLPDASPQERVWTALDRALGAGGTLPSAEALTEELASPGGTGWSVIADGLDPAMVGALHRELAALERSEVLALVRGGVGADDRASTARSDRVAYLTGLEPELLAAAPSVATLAQWLLHRLALRVTEALPGDLHAPMSVMLARYSAPCRGFAPHLDNPGGDQDNGRAVTAVVYLNALTAPCVGGEISLWGPGRPGRDSGPLVVSPAGGTLALFDARRVVHEVLPLQPGPDRWSMVLWLSDAPRPRPVVTEPPRPTPAEVLEPLDRDVPVPAGRVVLRTMPSESSTNSSSSPAPAATVRSVPVRSADSSPPRAGIVCTTSRPDGRLQAWCRHHLSLGFDHLVVVVDEAAPSGAIEEAGALLSRIEGGSDRITLWGWSEAARRWPDFAGDEAVDGSALREAADAGEATHAVAARQALNATAALVAARRGELGGEASGAPLDWLLHLDDDELFHLEGAARGGAEVGEHFAALEALRREEPGRFSAIRYPNHELLLTRADTATARFKRNPRLAAARLGPVGWRRLIASLGMEQEGDRPYFRAYWNGKSAVAVERGRAAAGVHGWRLEADAEPDGGTLLAGPSILHLHQATARAFRDKYLAVAGAAGEEGGDRLFPPSPLEERAVGLIRRFQNAAASDAGESGQEALIAGLDALYDDALCFSVQEVEILEAAGLLVPVDLDLSAWTGADSSR